VGHICGMFVQGYRNKGYGGGTLQWRCIHKR
jgi:hypothetical protein